MVSLASQLAVYLPSFIERRRQTFEEIAAAVSNESIVRLRRYDAVAVLTVVAPLQMVGGCPAKDLPGMCRALVQRHLPGFCRHVLETWEQDRLIVDPAGLAQEDS